MSEMIEERAYGFKKRYDFLCEVLDATKPQAVLDVGCGTGDFLTIPLARTFPEIQFDGIDSDKGTVEYARKKNDLRNLKFILQEEFVSARRYDLVVISEVLEHVEDPVEFMRFYRSLLTPEGKIVLTIPNGSGPFEVMAFAENILYFLGVTKLFKRGKDRGEGQSDTMAISPHLNFFSFGQLCLLSAKTGLKVIRYRPRTFLCGHGLDLLLFSPGLIAWNAKVADSLPPAMVSDWMFLLGQDTPNPGAQFQYGWFWKWRRGLNQKRYSLKKA